MRTRKTEAVEHENVDRWLVSYADFITLMFAFFVVMYAISSVNIGKFQEVSNTLDAVFHVDHRSKKPLQIGELARSPNDFSGHEEESKAQLKDSLQIIEDSVASKFSSSKNIIIRHNPNSLDIEIKDDILFASGQSELRASALPILQEIAVLLQAAPNAVHVEGHTDNQPIDTIFYPSNWDLSVARSAAVVRYMTRMGLPAERVAAVGFAEFQPIADNNSAFGRKQNRRVIISVLPRKTLKETQAAEEEVVVIADEDFVGPLLPRDWRPAAEHKTRDSATSTAKPPTTTDQIRENGKHSAQELQRKNQSLEEQSATVSQTKENYKASSSIREQMTEDGVIRFIYDDSEN